MKQQKRTNEDDIRTYTRDVPDPKKTAKPEKASERSEGNSWLYLGKVGQIGFTISLPIVIGAFIGVYLDKVWMTYPKATLAGIFGGMFLSIVSFIRLVIELIRTP